MHNRVVFRILGVLLMMFSVSQAPPLLVSLYYGDGVWQSFVFAFLLTAGAGIACWWPACGRRDELRYRDGFLVVTLFWTVLAVFGAIPFVLAEDPVMSITDALFESMSGLTTTGATVLTGIDELPMSILYYRQQLQWLGGMGIIVLAVAVMPMLGVGGMQLYRAETPGPIKDSKLTPRIKESAKALWYLYLGLTVLCALGYYLAGMDLFDAVTHSFSTVAIGGFSTHDGSIGHFNNPLVSLVGIVFMVLAGINFALHFIAFRSRSASGYVHDPEVRVYLTILVIGAATAVAVLWYHDTFNDFSRTLLHGVFQVVSIATTTGFTTVDYSVWPSFLPVMLLFLSIVGGCAGSTAGGIKVIRAILLFRQGRREISRLIHPNALIPLKLGQKVISDNVLTAVWGFFALYVFSFGVLMLIMTGTGADMVTAFSAVTACLNNLGPGLGEVSHHYATISDPGKWTLGFAMLLGRLELFTLLVVFSRAFWKA